MKTVRDLYRKLNNKNEIPNIEGQGNFTADQMIWFGEQVVKLFTIPVVSGCYYWVQLNTGDDYQPAIATDYYDNGTMYFKLLNGGVRECKSVSDYHRLYFR